MYVVISTYSHEDSIKQFINICKDGDVASECVKLQQLRATNLGWNCLCRIFATKGVQTIEDVRTEIGMWDNI